jgi:hypothetical protein
MQDLANSASGSVFWAARSPEMMLAVTQMQSREDWTLDDELKTQLEDLCTRVVDKSFAKRLIANSDEAMQLVSWLSTPTGLMLLSKFETGQPGIANQMISDCISRPANIMSAIFIERLHVLGRVNLLDKLFSSERVEMVLRAANSSMEIIKNRAISS